ncbi:class I SAM-dependent methyltransferase [Amaricoccus macauensis]|uniref:class I SAM-dependent methyltransferase n=1 Tax=Amaricoccus macauensis TaxID=57001 RepID=UPI003C7B1EEA
MTISEGNEPSHAALMNETYRYQRWIYDATRKYFLFGRDHLIADLAPPPGGSVLEVGCGTGRNLRIIDHCYPGCALHGLDISSEMLRSARKKLGDDAVLAEADATDFDAQEVFGRAGFDRVVLSFALSMIPDWRAALRQAAGAVAPGGSLHVVDFGTQEGMPGWFRGPLNAWLAKFHVEPRHDLGAAIADLAKETGASVTCEQLHRSYSIYATLQR